MLLESFVIHKALVGKSLLKILKFEYVFFVTQTFIKCFQIYYEL
jgi:hypothetical protein